MNQNQTESKPQDVEEPRDEGLDETTCCASSDTPETDECTGSCICHAVGLGDQEDACPREKMVIMELQRNALRTALRDMLDMWHRACEPRNIEFDSQVIAARAALSLHNVKCPPTGAEEKEVAP